MTRQPTTHHAPAGRPLPWVSSENRQTGVGAGHRLLPGPTHRDHALPSAPETWPRPGVLGPAARPQQSGWNTSPQAACSPPGLGPRRLRRPRRPGAHRASFRSDLSGNDGERSCALRPPGKSSGIRPCPLQRWPEPAQIPLWQQHGGPVTLTSKGSA